MTTAAITPLVCPSWCCLAAEEHQIFEEWVVPGGRAQHTSASRKGWVTVSHVLRVDGVRELRDRGPAIVFDEPELKGTPAEIAAQAEELIRDLRAAVAVVNA
jgi:hypothetical protein